MKARQRKRQTIRQRRYYDVKKVLSRSRVQLGLSPRTRRVIVGPRRDRQLYNDEARDRERVSCVSECRDPSQKSALLQFCVLCTLFRLVVHSLCPASSTFSAMLVPGVGENRRILTAGDTVFSAGYQSRFFSIGELMYVVYRLFTSLRILLLIEGAHFS